jgi:hypothetical protein
MNSRSINHGSRRILKKVLDQRKQAKLQWLQNPSEINGDKLDNKRREASRQFRNKSGNIRKTKLMSLQRTVRT